MTLLWLGCVLAIGGGFVFWLCLLQNSWSLPLTEQAGFAIGVFGLVVCACGVLLTAAAALFRLIIG